MAVHKPIPDKYFDKVMDIRDYIKETGNYNEAFEEYGGGLVENSILKFYFDRWKREAKNWEEQEEFFYIAIHKKPIDRDVSFYAYRKISECEFYVLPSTDRGHAKKQLSLWDCYPRSLFLTYERYKTFEDAEFRAIMYNVKAKEIFIKRKQAYLKPPSNTPQRAFFSFLV